jgi:hypothetical protein
VAGFFAAGVGFVLDAVAGFAAGFPFGDDIAAAFTGAFAFEETAGFGFPFGDDMAAFPFGDEITGAFALAGAAGCDLAVTGLGAASAVAASFAMTFRSARQLG